MTTLSGLQNTVGWWSASLDSGARGTLVATDLSSNANNGTLTNMDGATDWPADTGNGGTHAWDFDGSNDYIDCGSGFATFSRLLPFSVSFWVKTTQADSTLVSKWARLISSGWMVYLGGGKVGFGLLTAAGGGRYGTGGTNINDGNWHHVVCTYDGSDTIGGLQIWVDGIRETITTVSNTAVDTLVNSPFRIGYHSGSIDGSVFFQGRIDDVKVVSRVISTSEINYSRAQRSRLHQPGYSTNSLRNGLVYCVTGLQDHTAASYGLTQSQSANFLNMLTGLSAATIIVWAKQVSATDAYLILSGPTNLCTIFNRGGTTALWFYFNGQTYTTGTGNNLASTPTMAWMRKGSNVDAGRNTTRLFGPTANAAAFSAPNSSVNISQSGAPVQSIALWNRELSDAELAAVHAAGPEIALPEAASTSRPVSPFTQQVIA